MEHIILYAIVPIIVVMLAGYISGKKGIFTGDDAKKFNKVVLDYALPAALFVSIAQASREMLAKDIKLSLVSLIGIMLCFMIVYFVFRMFKKNTGLSLKRYIVNQKMEAAKNLLVTTNLSVTLICERVGYVNYSNFIRAFRQIVGCTPSEYRKMKRKRAFRQSKNMRNKSGF